MKYFTSFMSLMSAGVLASASWSAPSDILFVLDGSGSMWGQIEGEAKIATAKSTMIDLMDQMPGEARLGLMTYGTTSKESCSDVAVLNGLGAGRDAIKASIERITPLGKTPIQNSLMQGITMLANTDPSDVQKSLVLVSDGIETCGGNPCAIASTAQFSGVEMKVHVVGFDVDDEARAQLQCIAENGGGQYFDASDTAGFKSALQDVVVLAQATAAPEPAPEPEPTGPVITEVFRDDFDGEDLSESWVLSNPNPESYVVEDGALLMLTSAPEGFSQDGGENLITYTGDLPRGDWDATITFTGELTASGNALYFGLRKDQDNFLTSMFTASRGLNCYSTSAHLQKTSKGEAETVSRMYRMSVPKLGNCYTRLPLGSEEWDSILADYIDAPSSLTLSKRGRSYTTTLTMEGVTLEDGSPYVVETDQFSSLRSPGELSFTIGRYEPGKSYESGTGEVLFMIDSVVISSVQE